ncbi:MAG: HD domain-containing protein [Synergistaceae bacterium]|nr:HD domain-containing protein [Synergistaceae bacterium]
MKSIESISLDRIDLEDGVLARDILSPSLVLLLPAGLNLATLRTTRPDLVDLLRKNGIHEIPIKKHEPITPSEFRTLLHRIVPPVTTIDPLLAQVTVYQMNAVYDNIREKDTRERGIHSLLSVAQNLPGEIRKGSQITLSLAEKHSPREREALHGLNVALLSGYISDSLFPLWRSFTEELTTGGLFHDMGKAFLGSPGEPEEKNERILLIHPLLGETLLRDSGISDRHILSSVRSHHEAWDGSGHPDGLSGNKIPLAARILSVANLFDSILSTAPDGERTRSDQAISSLISCTEGRFDRSVVRALLASIGLYPPGSVVELSDGRTGVVLETRERDLLRPRVLLMEGLRKNREQVLEILDLKKETSLHIRKAGDDYGRQPFKPLEKVGGGRPRVIFRKNRVPVGIKN